MTGKVRSQTDPSPSDYFEEGRAKFVDHRMLNTYDNLYGELPMHKE